MEHEEVDKRKIDWNGQLPVELWFEIFKEFEMKHLVSLSLICKHWETLLRDDLLWQHFFHSKFKGLEVFDMTKYGNSYFHLCKELAFFPPIGSKCLAEWLDEDYYSGTIRKIVESHDWLIVFPGGGSRWIPSCSDMLPDLPLLPLPSETTTNIPNPPVDEEQSRPDKVGTKVLTLWRNDNEYTEAVILSGPNSEGLYEVELLDSQFFNRPVKLKRLIGELRRYPTAQEASEWRNKLKLKTKSELEGVALTIEFMAAGLRGWMRGVIQRVGQLPYFQYHIQYDDGDLGWVRRDQIKKIFIPAPEVGLKPSSKKVELPDMSLAGKRVLVPATKGKGIYYPGRISPNLEELSEVWCWLTFKKGKLKEIEESEDDEDSDPEDEDEEISVTTTDPLLEVQRPVEQEDDEDQSEEAEESVCGWSCGMCGTTNRQYRIRCEMCNSMRVLQLLYIELERLKEANIGSTKKVTGKEATKEACEHIEEPIKNFMKLIKRKGATRNYRRLYRVTLEASKQDLWAPRDSLMEVPEEGTPQATVGDPVIAQWSKGFWYPGLVSTVATGGNPGQMTIAFDTNDLIVVDRRSVVKRT